VREFSVFTAPRTVSGTKREPQKIWVISKQEISDERKVEGLNKMGTQVTTPGVTSAANAYQTAFNTAYYASKPPAFQPLYGGRPGAAMASSYPLTQDQAWALVGKLIAQGWVVDEEIDAEAMDPYTTMFMRELYGQTWEPASLGETQSNQALTPGMYSGPVPAGQIKVSTMIEDYPPYPVPIPPVPPPTPQVANPIGVRIIAQTPSAANYVGDVFRCATANDGFTVGETWSGTSGAFTGSWTKQALLAGMMIVWTKTQ
jgi:hypothetical protein